MAKLVALTPINAGGSRIIQPGEPVDLPKAALEALRDAGKVGTEKDFEASGGSPAATGALRDQVAQLKAALAERDRDIAALGAKVAELSEAGNGGENGGGAGAGTAKPEGELEV